MDIKYETWSRFFRRRSLNYSFLYCFIGHYEGIIRDMSAYDKQIGGTHYRKMKIQPSKFVIENELLFPEGNVIKYVCRHKYKGGKEDLKKAKHYIEMIEERDYGNE